METGWWMKNNLRMIQNNIRDIDAQMDIDTEIEMLKRFGANVLQIGCGGITAFSNTNLSVQRKSAYLKDDMFGKILKKCHENDIRVIARFDVSKAHKDFAKEYPEWFCRSLKGKMIRYHDTYATCVNGDYQQKYALDIIREIIEKYPVDGIFFNMFGYQTRNYSGQYVGICQCENCKRRFREMFGEVLPVREERNDPVYRHYEEFKVKTVHEMLERIYHLVKEINPQIAISTYNSYMIDVIRSESNSAVDRPYPFWIYSGSENVSSVEDTFEKKMSSNCAINAVDLPYRFMGVSKYLNQIRLYQNMANNSGLDWCIIGTFENYPDRENFESTRKIFQFHKKHERYYGCFRTPADILLIKPGEFSDSSPDQEYRGIFKALKESHQLFHNVQAEELEHAADSLDDYRIVIIPGIQKIGNEKFLNALKNTKTAVLVTGLGLKEEQEYLKEVFGVSLKEPLKMVRGSYLKTEPKEVFSDFCDRDWVYLDKDYMQMELAEGMIGLMPLVSSARFGPPERCFGHVVTEQPSVAIRNGRLAYMPWKPGTLYYSHGYEDFKKILMDVIKFIGPGQPLLETNAPDMVEVFYGEYEDGSGIVQLINLTGFNGTTVLAPVPLKEFYIDLKGKKPICIRELTEDGERNLPVQSRIWVKDLELYKVYVIDFCS